MSDPCDALLTSATALRRDPPRLAEQRVTVTARSTDRAIALELDGVEGRAWLETDGQLCDGAFVWRDPPRALLVELKGRNVEEGLDQLAATVLAVRRRSGTACPDLALDALVVSNASAPGRWRQLQLGFEQRHRVRLRLKSGVKEPVPLSDLRALFGPARPR